MPEDRYPKWPVFRCSVLAAFECSLTQGVDPYTYLVDVLQRVATHPASEVAGLTPRLWKERFAKDPLRSDIDRPVKNADS